MSGQNGTSNSAGGVVRSTTQDRAIQPDAADDSPSQRPDLTSNLSDSSRPQLPALQIPSSIPAYLRPSAHSSRGPASASAAASGSPLTAAAQSRTSNSPPAASPVAPSSPAGTKGGGNRRRAHSVGVTLRPRSSSRAGGIQGLTTNFGLPSNNATTSGAGVIREQEEEGAAGHPGDNRDVLDMAERGTAVPPESPSDPLIAPNLREREEEGERRSRRVSIEPNNHATTDPDASTAHSTSGGRIRGRTRGSSIVDRIRNSIENRERRDSRDINGEPVGYEVAGGRAGGAGGEGEELDDGVVGMLDVMDAEVSTDSVFGVNHLQNVTNSIFLPHFPALWSRRPEIVIEHDQIPASSSPPLTRPAPPLLNTALEGSDGPSTAVDPSTPLTGATAQHTQPRARTGTRKTRSSTVAGLYAPSPITPTFGVGGGGGGPGAAHVRGQRPPLPRILSQPSPHPDYAATGLGTFGSDGDAPYEATASSADARSEASKLVMPATRARFAPIDDQHASTSPPSDRFLLEKPVANAAIDGSESDSQSVTGVKSEHHDDLDDPDNDHSLDQHVRQVLHASKRDRIKKGLKGLWVFLKTPMGFIVGIYGVLVVFWGAALVIILAGWIPMPNKWWQDRWVEICSQIVNGLFTITGVGLIPWRVQDTYRMIIISSLKRRTHIKRRKAGLPPIDDPNDIPDPKEQEDYVSVLTEKEQARLTYQQEKFAQSQTWYRPHATATHTAFPITWALWNTVLMDLNSAFQCMLCGCMWGLNQYQRPAWTTGSLIPLSFLCGIGAGVLIWQGSARTKKRETVEDKLRMALGVPLAIALPQTKDGTFITGNNKASISGGRKGRRKSSGAATGTAGAAAAEMRRRSGSGTGSAEAIALNRIAERSDKGDTDSEGDADHGEPLGGIPLAQVVSPAMNRRATVTLGNVPESMVSDEEDMRRKRGQTIGHVEELRKA